MVQWEAMYRFAILGIILVLGYVAKGSSAPIQYPSLHQKPFYPHVFEANRGQADPSVRFLARTAAYDLLLTSRSVLFRFTAPLPRTSPMYRAPEIRLLFRASRPATLLTGLDKKPSRSHYFIGQDPAAWVANVPHFGRVQYVSLYPGIDLIFHGTDGKLEFDFVVRPYSDPSAISFSVTGTRKTELERNGDLLLTAQGFAASVRLKRPIIYQEETGGHRVNVPGDYVLEGGSRVGFRIGRYNRYKALVIDPTIVYSSFFGGTSGDSSRAITLDPAGNIYIAGHTYSRDLPVTAGAYQTTQPTPPTRSGSAYVAKFTPDGKRLLYATYFGGSEGEDPTAIAADERGSAYLVGFSGSPDLPLVNALRRTRASAFVAKFAPDGAGLVYSTYFGGSGYADWPWRIAVDRHGNAVIVGVTASRDFPLVNAVQPAWGGSTWDGFVAKLSASGSELVYSTFLGGNNYEEVRAVALDSDGNAYVTGMTRSSTFPTTLGAFQTNQGEGRGFLTKLNPSGSRLLYSTYLPGEGFAVAVDSGGNSWITGTTSALPVTQDAFQRGYAGNDDAFLVRINASGSSLLYASFLGGSDQDIGRAVSLDAAGNVYVVGSSYSRDFPLQSSMYAPGFGFVTVFKPSGGLLYSTLLPFGTIGTADAAGNVYLITTLRAQPFPTTPDAVQASPGGDWDALLLKIVPPNPVPLAAQLSPSTIPYGVGPFTLTVDGSGFVSGAVIRWDGSDRPTAFVSNTRLTAAISEADIAVPRGVPVSAFNGQPGGGLGNSLTFRVHPNPVLNQNGATDAATFAPFLKAGSIASLFGWNLATRTESAAVVPLPTSLAGTVLRVNGMPAPLFFVSRTQINFQVPWEVRGQEEIMITVSREGNVSEPLRARLVDFVATIFGINQRGTGQGAIVIEGSGSLAAPVSSGIPGARPAKRGQDFVQIYCQGLGTVTNQPPTGFPALGDPLSSADSFLRLVPRVMFGGVSSDVIFAGLAPGFVGLYQVNAFVPASAPTGDAVPVVIRLSTGGSNTVTMAITD